MLTNFFFFCMFFSIDVGTDSSLLTPLERKLIFVFFVFTLLGYWRKDGLLL